MSHGPENSMATKTKKTHAQRPAGAVGSGTLIRRLRALEKHWLKEAAAFHSMGKRMSLEGNMAGNEYMQTAAAFRACARDLKAARLPNI